jgi:PAS domain S-box-containing protein
MAKSLAVLIVEAVENDVQLILRLLKKAGFKPAFEQAKTPTQLRRALKKQAWEVVISGYSLPKLDGPTALKILQETGLELPFIVVSENMGEEAAVEMMQAGASDCVLKDNLRLLVPIVERELKHAAAQRESKLAEEALRESEEKWRALVSATPDYIALHDPKGRYLFLNHYAEGYSEKDVIGTSLYKYISPESVELFRSHMEKALKTWTAQHFEYNGLGDGGSKRIYEESLVPMRDKNHQVEILAVARDITERKLVQEALRESEDKFKYVFDHSVTGKSITLPSGEINVNHAFCEMVGYSQEELKNRTWQELTHPEDVEITQNAVNKLLSGKRKSVRFNKRYVHKNGSIVWGDVGIGLRRDKDGHPLYYMTSINDITERMSAEEDLRDLSMRQEVILAAIPDILMEVNQDKVYTWANPSGLAFFGEDVIGKKAAFYFEGEQDTYDVVTPIFQGGKELIYVESWQRRKDGEKRLLAWWCRGIKDMDGNATGALSSALDITERKQAEETIHNLARFPSENPNPVLRVARDGNVLYANKAALLLLKDWELELGKPVPEVLKDLACETFDTRKTKTVEISCGEQTYSITMAPALEDEDINVYALDITERKQAEEEIKAMLRTTIDGYYLVDVGGRILDANDSYSMMIGYSHDELLKMHVKDIEAVDSDEIIKKRIQRILETGSDHFETRHRRKDGRVIEIEASVNYLIEEQPKLFCFMRDITERKRAEQDLRDSEERFRSLYENATIGMYRTTPEGNILLANSALISMLGYESFEQLSTRDLASEGYEPRYPRLEFQNRIEQEGEVRGLESAWKRKDGSIIFVRESAHLVQNENDEPVYYEGTVEDISERQQTQTLQEAVYRIAAAAETTRSLDELYPQIHQIISSVMPAKNFFITLYDKAQNLLRFPYFKDAEDEPFMGEIQPGKGLTAYVLRTGKSLLCTQAVHDELERQGEVKLLGVPSAIWLGVPLIVEGKTIGTMVVQHYSDPKAYGEREQHMLEFVSTQVAIAINRVRVEEEIRQLNAELEQRVEERTRELRQAQDKIVRQEKLAMLGQLAGGVGHELRNPLGIISSGIYYLKLIQPDADAKVKQYHAMIDQEVRNSEKIITDLLDFARLESMEREQVSIPELVQATLARFPVPESIKTTIRLPADLPRVHADLLQMEQVLGNLTVNACQAMISSSSTRAVASPKGLISQGATNGVVKRGRLIISARRVGPVSANPSKSVSSSRTSSGKGRSQQKGMVAISVKDNGAGITPENMSKLFEPLFTTKSKGIGLGLAVSRKLAEANGGRIEVKSEMGKGSTFTLFLPVEAG